MTENTKKVQYSVQKGLPIPSRHFFKKTGSKYPFAELEVGDSFFVPGGKFGLLSVLPKEARKNITGRTVTEKDADGNDVTGLRLWRVA